MTNVLDSTQLLKNPNRSDEDSIPLATKLGIRSRFSHPLSSQSLSEHVSQIEKILLKIVSGKYFFNDKKKFGNWLKTALPLIHWNEISNVPESLSICLLCTPSKQLKTEELFLDIIKKWLIPEREIQILSFQNMRFYLPDILSEQLFICEAKILIEDGRDLTAIQKHLPILAKEITLGIYSSKYAQYILDTKALSYNQKTTVIHQELMRLIQKRPNHFDQDIFTEMGRFLALSNNAFRDFRPHRHITRLIATHYLMRRNLIRSLSQFPEKRYLEMRVIRTDLNFPFGSKPVLGIAIGLNLIDKYECFEDTHVLLAVQKFIKNVQLIKDSFYTYHRNQDSIRLLYLELEKKDDTHFTPDEIRKLQLELEEELKKRIERLIPSVFMIRNEEETIKSILLLSQELKYLYDFPQVMITLDKQTPTDLIFAIVMVRILKEEDLPIEQCFSKVKGDFQVISERVQIVGYLRKKRPKEANIFHVRIPKDHSVLRADSSVNFYLARHKVVSILNEAFGEIRDYNGGMILKQGELFLQFKQLFKEISEKNHELLENFFFSINPIEMQATLSLSALETLFDLFLESLKDDLPKRNSYFLKIHRDKSQTFVVLRTRDPSIKDMLAESLNKLELFSKSLIKTSLNVQGSLLFGYLYETHDLVKHEQFSEMIENVVKNWLQKIQNQQVLRLSFIDLPLSLDPRLGGDEISVTILKMLYDGLMRIGHNSKPEPAVAQTVKISADYKRYTFHLRECYWSNGSRVIAYDFEYAWKKILSPGFSTSFAYFFYPIKNAREAKEGKVPLEQVGVFAQSDDILILELEHPSREFLELTAHAIYSPVPHLVDKIHPNWSQGSEDLHVCNGPFKLKKYQHGASIEFVKNPDYWDRDVVKLDQILISKSNAYVANKMFKNDEIDWLGRPMHPWEPPFDERNSPKIRSTSHGVYWCVFNVQRFPFHNLKIRQAFAFALDRTELVKQLQYDGLPASSPLPFAHSQNCEEEFSRGNKELAKKLFKKGLEELGIKKEKFPIISLIHTDGQTREEAVQWMTEQWEKVLGIQCRTECYEFHLLFSKMVEGDYQLGTMSWKAWINEPIYTLNAFKYRNDKLNFSKWENLQYQTLLDSAQKEISQVRRRELLNQAEKILISEMPVVPIVYEVQQCMHKKELKGALYLTMGNVEFKWASIVPST